MSTTEIRESLIRNIEEADDKLLKMLYAVVEIYQNEEVDPIIGYTIDGKPKRASEMEEQLQIEVEAAKRGEYITLEELRKKSDEWLNRTK